MDQLHDLIARTSTGVNFKRLQMMSRRFRASKADGYRLRTEKRSIMIRSDGDELRIFTMISNDVDGLCFYISHDAISCYMYKNGLRHGMFCTYHMATGIFLTIAMYKNGYIDVGREYVFRRVNGTSTDRNMTWIHGHKVDLRRSTAYKIDRDHWRNLAKLQGGAC